MAPARTITISNPFDPRHVAGVNIGREGGVHRSFTFEPDEVPTHMNIAASQPPKRSNTITHSLSRPSLKLKTSISRLRARSSSNSPDTHDRKKELPTTPEDQRLPQLPPRPVQPAPSSSTTASSAASQPKPVPQAPLPPPKNSPTPKSSTKLLPTRPRRADSGTAIDFHDVPAEARPLGFQEILRVKSFEERMALYKRARDYWAGTDHGLGDWVGRAKGAPVV
jgi:hypothetical protein